MADWSIQGGSETKMEAFGQQTGTLGTEIPPSATPHVKGSWVELSASTSFGYESLSFVIRKRDATDHLFDIGIGSIGNEVAIAPNIPVNFKHNGSIHSTRIDLPISIPAGTRISMRCQASTGDVNDELNVMGYGLATGFASTSGLSKAVTYGVSTATSQGTPVDAGATINTKGSWTELTASTSEDLKKVIVSIGLNSNTTPTNAAFRLDIGVGAGGSEEVILGDLYWFTSSVSDALSEPYWLIEFQIPKNSRIAARLQSTSNDVADRVLSVSIVGMA